MYKYKITLKNHGVRESKGETPIEAFNAIFPDMVLTPLRFNCVSANVCIELLNGSRHTINYYAAQNKPLKVNQNYNDIVQFLKPYIEQDCSITHLNNGIWNANYSLPAESMQLIKQHGGIVGALILAGETFTDRDTYTYIFKDLSYGYTGNICIYIKGKLNTISEAQALLSKYSSKYMYQKLMEERLQNFGSIDKFREIGNYAKSKIHLEPSKINGNRKISCIVDEKSLTIEAQIFDYVDMQYPSWTYGIKSKEDVDAFCKKNLTTLNRISNKVMSPFKKV